MKILGIESSCDETAASVVEVIENPKHVKVLSSVTATSLHLHAATGGIIPEIAARNQIKDIIPVIYKTLEKADVLNNDEPPMIDAIAVTYGPGLIGSLLVGVETAKTLSYIWEKPLIPVNHLFGHLYANWIETGSNYSSGEKQSDESRSFNRHPELDSGSNLNSTFQTPEFPAIGLIISGGHTDLVLMRNHEEVTWLGGTRDDAAGEAFDKIGRMLGLPYPAGPLIEQLAKKAVPAGRQGNPKTYNFPRPLKYDKALDFSFSGLKTAVLRVVEKSRHSERSEDPLDDQTIADICFATQDAISDVIIYKTLQAAEQFSAKSILVGGGVAANTTLKEKLQQTLSEKNGFANIKLFVPHRSLCTDNGTMIAAAAAFQNKTAEWNNVTANPELYFD